MRNMVSVIVPVYNCEKFLKKCIDSIINQSYTDLEIILVDDGSTDKSGIICDSYREKDCRIRVIHKENGGVSSARNFGLDLAVGDYIFFVDSDDYLNHTCIQKLVLAQKQNKADIIVGNAIDVRENGSTIANGGISEGKLLKKDDAIYHFLKADYFTAVCWGRLYCRSCIKFLRFDEHMRIAEDGKFFLNAIENSESIFIIPEKLYYYVIRDGSAVHSGFTQKYYDELKFCEELAKANHGSEKLREISEYKLYLYIQRLLYMRDLPYEDFLYISEKLTRICKEMKKVLPIKERIKNFVYCTWWLRNIYFRVKYDN